MSRAEKIEFAVTFLLDNQDADNATKTELLKDEGLSGGEIMEALAEATARGGQ
jgi:hypothetical protein